MTEKWSGAGELSPSPDAMDSNGGQPIQVLSSLQVPATSRRIPNPEYDPRGIRPCARCGSRTDWRRLEALGGGWLCCPSRELLEANRDILQHQCSILCAAVAS
jgi:hypothetical protein